MNPVRSLGQKNFNKIFLQDIMLVMKLNKN